MIDAFMQLYTHLRTQTHTYTPTHIFKGTHTCILTDAGTHIDVYMLTHARCLHAQTHCGVMVSKLD